MPLLYHPSATEPPSTFRSTGAGTYSDLSAGTIPGSKPRPQLLPILGTHTYQQAGHYEVAAIVSNVFFEQPS